MLQNTLYKEHLLDLLEYGIYKAAIKVNEVYGNDGLVYYRKYSRKYKDYFIKIPALTG